MPKGWNIVLPSAGPLRAMLAGVGLATVAFMATPVQALVCPIMPEQGLAGAIKEPKKEIEGLSQLFPGPELDSRLAIEIEDLRLDALYFAAAAHFVTTCVQLAIRKLEYHATSPNCQNAEDFGGLAPVTARAE